MARQLTRAALLVIGALHGANAAAIDLQQAYEAALKNDPVYRAAYYENEGGKEYANLGEAGLLPSVSASYGYNKNRADIEQASGTSQPKYRSRTGSVQLRQSILNLEAVARYKQGVAQTRLSAAQFDARGQELVLRVTSAYLDALLAADELALAQAHRDACIEQRKVNDRLFQHGEGSRTDMIETQARLDVAEADLIDAQDREVEARNTLAGIVGMPVDVVSGLAAGFKPGPLPDGGYAQWQERALAGNPELQAQAYAVEAARQEINRSRAGHAPRLDFVASYNANESDTLNTLNQRSTVRSVGLQLTVPLYAGGQVSAASRQAVAAHERAQADLQARTDKLLIELRKQYKAAASGQARIGALEQAVASGELLVKATEQSIRGGVRINLDLLNARQQLFGSQRDLAKARYNYFLSELKLRAAVGTVGAGDVREMAINFR
ncbi:MAG: TolC family outer membrane protein [Pseudomonadota bacterium]